MPCGEILTTMSMPTYSRGDVVLVSYPFSNLIGTKVRPAVVVNAPHVSRDLFIVPLTSRIGSLLAGEFVLADWKKSGLNVATAVKRGVYTVHEGLVIKRIGALSGADVRLMDGSLRLWLGVPNAS
ncbi:MAG: mRNA interferase MazF [Acidobacteriota bacterium]|nr:mRNA interferase MazF [Acidobacteriota bacterium]